jgi:hypothetical protein
VRIILIDPFRMVVEEREVSSSVRAFARALSGPFRFCGWFGADAIYAGDHAAWEEAFVINDALWVSGAAIIAGAAAGSRALRKPASTKLDKVLASVRFEKVADDGQARFVNGASSSPLSDEEILLRMVHRDRSKCYR